MKTSAKSHVGKVRTVNEDTVYLHTDIKPCYMMVADGMGGHAAGEVASRITCDSIRRYIDEHHLTELTKDDILRAIDFANAALRTEMEKDELLNGMGTTLTFAAIKGDDIIIAQVGDSRAYHFNGDVVRKVTDDHTYVQYLIDSGVIKGKAASEYPFKNIITRAIGMKDLKVDFFEFTWQDQDMLLLCSDGLTNYADDNVLKQVLSENSSLSHKTDKLVDIALDGGGKDNISVVIAQQVKEGDKTV
ncbi:MAG: Stp1/IreP family PP2C-type Ser/Thr phosphatase [Christensenella sp.]|uniref:Stp1/IreP family PP2C-type Ser/Thr phosphatase n=1 Tax=Christensenella sp. TaxID=1935934 RepID=UPI002B1EB502|nr:Stp1/IreP family PP2C-type Ser/Thr phosphatase [Christensenella sp.]MEA5004664.1 Stp1/IreP family PP2C-type Ser/Thr phosphatase [Christensenella sp.]